MDSTYGTIHDQDFSYAVGDGDPFDIGQQRQGRRYEHGEKDTPFVDQVWVSQTDCPLRNGWMHVLPDNYYAMDLTDEPTSTTATTIQYIPTSSNWTTMNVMDCPSDEALNLNLYVRSYLLPNAAPVISQRDIFSDNDLSTPTDNTMTLGPQTPVPQVQATIAASDDSSIASLTLPSSPGRTKRQRRMRTSSSDAESDRISGHVLASGKFKCADPECDDLRFGRQADFRRHRINVHSEKKTEYFCTVEGCDRSRRPLGKSKGRSFGARKDKMEEHVQAMHSRLSRHGRKLLAIEAAEGVEQEEEDVSDDTEGAE